jgi:hypothetical protein
MLAPNRPFDHPAYCVLPFYSWEYPLNTACCLWSPGWDLDKIKQEMLAGQRPTACNKCWNLEDHGVKSDRQLKNETVDFYFDRNIHDLLEESQQGKNSIRHYKIDTSNTCNATCITCGAGSSSSWADLLKKTGQQVPRNWQIVPEKIDSNIDYTTARLITFRGGEPLLSKTNFHILEQLLAVSNSDCFISFQTNGSIIPTPEQEQLLRQFKNLNFSFSIDGIGPVFEYVRYPLKWADIEKTMAWCRDRNIMISVNYTVSNVNVFYHQQTCAWFDQQKIPYLLNPVYDPEWFAPSVLPDELKTQINFEFIAGENHQALYPVFRQQLAQQDSLKGIRMQDYLPELADRLG